MKTTGDYWAAYTARTERWHRSRTYRLHRWLWWRTWGPGAADSLLHPLWRLMLAILLFVLRVRGLWYGSVW